MEDHYEQEELKGGFVPPYSWERAKPENQQPLLTTSATVRSK